MIIELEVKGREKGRVGKLVLFSLLCIPICIINDVKIKIRKKMIPTERDTFVCMWKSERNSC